jgi:hypothetical protein
MAIAAVDELVGTPGEAALRRILPRRQPGDETWKVEVLWDDTLRGIEDGQTAQGTKCICAMCFGIRLL